MARPNETYRPYRRNLALKTMKTMWGPEWYYENNMRKPKPQSGPPPSSPEPTSNSRGIRRV